MANERPIQSYTAADIEKYHRGLLSAGERHALEKAALDDPFLADALEGYAVGAVNAAADMAELEKRLAGRLHENLPTLGAGNTRFPWLRAAAMIIVLAGVGLLVYQLGFNKRMKEAEIAQSPAKTEVKSPDTLQTDAANEQAGLLHHLDSPASSGPGQEKKTQTVTTNNNFTTRRVQDVQAGSTASVRQPDTTVNQPAAAFNELASDKSAKTELKKQDDEKEGIASRKLPETQIQASSQPASKEKLNETVVLKEADADKFKKASEANRKEGNYLKSANIFRGRVTDLQNNAVPFANVTNREDNVGTYTDAKGYFNLTSPDSILDVQVRSLGYTDNNARLYNNIRNNQVLMQEDRSLNEVVISQKKPNASSRARTNTMKLENESEPEPEDGWENYDSYLANNLNIPEDFKRMKQTGVDSVRLSFEVNKYGMPVNIKVLKSLCDRCDQEAIRLVKEGPRWKRKKGRTTVTVSF